MQVFVVGSPLETAMALSPRHLRNQINEAHIILAAICGESKAWSHHPVVLMYSELNSAKWLQMYADILERYLDGSLELISDNIKAKNITPSFHTPEFIENMKKRLYTKDPVHYAQWAGLGKSEENWYWSPCENGIIKYVNGKRIK